MTNKTITSLNKLLCNYFGLFTKTLGYHWNVTGCHFFELHEHFGKMYGSQLEVIDDLAERIRMLGETAPSNLAASVNNGKALSKWQDMVTDLIKHIEALCKNMHEVADISEKEKDLVTFDMMVKLLTDHEKELWMLKSLIEKSSK